MIDAGHETPEPVWPDASVFDFLCEPLQRPVRLPDQPYWARRVDPSQLTTRHDPEPLTYETYPAALQDHLNLMQSSGIVLPNWWLVKGSRHNQLFIVTEDIEGESVANILDGPNQFTVAQLQALGRHAQAVARYFANLAISKAPRAAWDIAGLPQGVFRERDGETEFVMVDLGLYLWPSMHGLIGDRLTLHNWVSRYIPHLLREVIEAKPRLAESSNATSIE